MLPLLLTRTHFANIVLHVRSTEKKDNPVFNIAMLLHTIGNTQPCVLAFWNHVPSLNPGATRGAGLAKVAQEIVANTIIDVAGNVWPSGKGAARFFWHVATTSEHRQKTLMVAARLAPFPLELTTGRPGPQGLIGCPQPVDTSLMPYQNVLTPERHTAHRATMIRWMQSVHTPPQSPTDTPMSETHVSLWRHLVANVVGMLYGFPSFSAAHSYINNRMQSIKDSGSVFFPTTNVDWEGRADDALLVLRNFIADTVIGVEALWRLVEVCPVCFDNPASILQACGHSVCSTCSTKLDAIDAVDASNRCVLCRQPRRVEGVTYLVYQ